VNDSDYHTAEAEFHAWIATESGTEAIRLLEGVNRTHRVILGGLQATLFDYRNAGEVLLSLKLNVVPKRFWGAFIASYFSGSKSTEERYRQVALHWRRIHPRLRNCTLRDFLALLREDRAKDRPAKPQPEPDEDETNPEPEPTEAARIEEAVNGAVDHFREELTKLNSDR
jgi:hypothetical protein